MAERTDNSSGPTLSPETYLSVALVAGSVIALQIVVMRIFAVGSWVHFGSLVISLAMFGFGLASAGCLSVRTFLITIGDTRQRSA